MSTFFEAWFRASAPQPPRYCDKQRAEMTCVRRLDSNQLVRAAEEYAEARQLGLHVGLTLNVGGQVYRVASVGFIGPTGAPHSAVLTWEPDPATMRPHPNGQPSPEAR